MEPFFRSDPGVRFNWRWQLWLEIMCLHNCSEWKKWQIITVLSSMTVCCFNAKVLLWRTKVEERWKRNGGESCSPGVIFFIFFIQISFFSQWFVDHISFFVSWYMSFPRLCCAQRFLVCSSGAWTSSWLRFGGTERLYGTTPLLPVRLSQGRRHRYDLEGRIVFMGRRLYCPSDVPGCRSDSCWSSRKSWRDQRLKPDLNRANVRSLNILRTVRRTMIRFLIELLVLRNGSDSSTNFSSFSTGL